MTASPLPFVHYTSTVRPQQKATEGGLRPLGRQRCHAAFWPFIASNNAQKEKGGVRKLFKAPRPSMSNGSLSVPEPGDAVLFSPVVGQVVVVTLKPSSFPASTAMSSASWRRVSEKTTSAVP